MFFIVFLEKNKKDNKKAVLLFFFFVLKGGAGKMMVFQVLNRCAKMALSKAEIEQLLEKYVQRRCNEGELAAVLNIFSDPVYEEQILAFMDREKDKDDELERSQTTSLSFEQLKGIIAQEEKSKRKYKGAAKLLWAAAIAVFLVALTLNSYLPINWREVASLQKLVAQDVLPGAKKAVLIKGDGSTTVLSSKRTIKISQHGQLSEEKEQEAQLIFEQASTFTQPDITKGQESNTLETPIGGEIMVVLPDGTRVWLNAASSLCFPSHFTGEERLVKLKGEAYFEVANDPKKRFAVDLGDTKIVVLGTHFNINAYAEADEMLTTLLSGKVRVEGPSASVVIRKGQAAEITKSTSEVHVKEAPYLEDAVAWKNGIFAFHNTDVKELMLTIARWYDVDIVYRGAKQDVRFDGYISRSSTLRDVLEIIKLSGIRCTIERGSLVVL